jgi:uncharacterized protein (TIGR03083 family)
LASLPDEKWEQVGPTPLGEQSFQAFMDIRLFDCWMHEQDVRRVVGLAGHLDGPIVEHALGRCALALGFVVAKKAAAPDGSTVEINVTGPLARRLTVQVADGRGRLTDEPTDDPSVRLTMDEETLWCLGGGRWNAEAVLTEGLVSFDGDRALGERIVRSLNFMI